MNGVEQGLVSIRVHDRLIETKQRFKRLIQTSEQVGDLYSINYETARVIIHDSARWIFRTMLTPPSGINLQLPK